MTTIKWRTSDAADPESLGDADLLTTLLAAAKVKQPRATANALLAEYGSFAEALGGATGMQEQATAYLATVRAAALITYGLSWRSNHASNSGCCSWTSATI